METSRKTAVCTTWPGVRMQYRRSLALLLSAGSIQLAFGSPALQTTNPATLVAAGKGSRWEAGVLTGRIDSDFSRPAAAGPASAGNHDSEAAYPVLPFFALSHPYNERVTFGFALDTPYHLDIAWKDHTFDVNFGGSALDLTKGAKVVATRVGPAAAIRLNEQWGVGGRLFVQYMEAMEDTDFAKVEGDGTTYGAQLGVRYAGKGYIVGAAYTTRTNTEVRGSQTNVHPLAAGALIAGDAKADILLPARVQGNVAFALQPDLWGEIDIEWQGWSYVDEQSIHQANGTISNQGKNLRHYRDIVATRIGLKWFKRPDMSIYGGIGYEPTPVPDQDATPARPFLHRTRAAFGAAWKLGAAWQLDMMYQLTHGHARTINETNQDSLLGADTNVYEGTYRSRAHAVRITLGGTF